jgi:hypothetical protein
MAYQVGDRVALKDDGAASAGSCGRITKDYGDGVYYDVEITHTAPPECKELEITAEAIYVEVVPCECPE